MSFTFSGFDDLKDQLDELANSAEKLSKKTSVSNDELFTPSFMSKHSSFSSLDDLLSSKGITYKTQKDFDSIPVESLDSATSSSTDFTTYQEMLDEAGNEYIEKNFDI